MKYDDVNKTVYEHFFKPERFDNLKKWMEATDKIDEIQELVETNTENMKMRGKTFRDTVDCFIEVNGEINELKEKIKNTMKKLQIKTIS